MVGEIGVVMIDKIHTLNDTDSLSQHNFVFLARWLDFTLFTIWCCLHCCCIHLYMCICWRKIDSTFDRFSFSRIATLTYTHTQKHSRWQSKQSSIKMVIGYKRTATVFDAQTATAGYSEEDKIRQIWKAARVQCAEIQGGRWLGRRAHAFAVRRVSARTFFCILNILVGEQHSFACLFSR